MGTGQFPPLRFSETETQKLLNEAYAAIPPKGISKKTRQKKRQLTRFKAIRKQRYIKKQEKIAHHYKKMEIRSKNLKDVLEMKENAKGIRVDDEVYRKKVLMKWAVLNGVVDENGVDLLRIGSGSSSVGEGNSSVEGSGSSKKQEMWNAIWRYVLMILMIKMWLATLLELKTARN